VKLQVPFIQLPLQFDATELAREVLAIDESWWRPHPQGYDGNSMLPLVSVDGDPGNETFSGEMRATTYLQSCPYLTQVLACLGATIGRTRLMRLSGHAEVKRHVDQGYYWIERVRVHVPIVTQPTVRFECGDAAVNMAAGECWIFDTWRQHRVVNDATQARIHLVADTVGGRDFWKLVGNGLPQGMPRGGWNPVRIASVGNEIAPFPLETRNTPVVMTPWELDTRLGFLFSEAVQDAQLMHARKASSELSVTWHGLWANFGDAPAGWPHFREAMDRFIADVKPNTQNIALRNGIRWYNAMMAAVGAMAVQQSMPAGQMPRESADNG